MCQIFAFSLLATILLIASEVQGLGTRQERGSLGSRKFRNGTKSHKFSTFREEYIPENYNPQELPPTEKKPPVVNISVVILNMRDIDEKHQDVSLEMNLRLYWEEPRLKTASAKVKNGTFMVLSTDMIGKLWHPDVFIDRTLEIFRPTILKVPASVRLYEDSTLRYSTRLNVKISCKMDFKFYPADNQRCGIHFMSYAYTKAIMDLGWGRRGAYVGRPFLLPNFQAKLESTSNHTTNSSSGDSYRTLVMTISLQRKLSHHLIQTYAPSTIAVILAWLTILLPDENSSDRLMGGVTLLLALIFLYISVGQAMPKVDYLTALDIWMVTCIIIVFAILIEYTAALKLRTIARKLLEIPERRVSIKESKWGHNGDTTRNFGDGLTNAKCRRAEKLQRMSMLLEKFSFAGLAIIFVVFNLIYWPWLLNSAEEYIKRKYME